MYPAGGLPHTPWVGVVDRHVAVGPGRYELAARLSPGDEAGQGSARAVRVRYTATWGSPVPVDAPSRVTLWDAPLGGDGGHDAEALLGLSGPGLRSRGLRGHALVLRDARGALLAAFLEGAVADGDGAPSADRAAGPGPRELRASRSSSHTTLRLRVSDRIDYTEVSRGDDLCLVTREHRSLAMRLGAGAWRLIPVGGYLDVKIALGGVRDAGNAPDLAEATFRVIVLDAWLATTQVSTCREADAGRLSIIVVRRTPR